MSTSILLLFIALAWILYPIAGALGVTIAIKEGVRPEGAGFSFFPELLVFPSIFFGIAYFVDKVFNPWGSWLVFAICVFMVITLSISITMNLRKLIKQKHEST